MKHTLFALALLVMPVSAQAAIEIGKPAPDFMAKDIHGNDVKLSDYIGKNVILEWTNHECPYVIKHYDTNNMQSAQKTATDGGAVWLTIASSAKGKQGYTSAEEAKNIIEQTGAKPTTRIIDASGEIGQLFSAKTTPHMFVIDVEGNLAYAGAIDSNSSPRIETVEGANNYVLAALDSLAAGEPVEPAQTAPYGCSIKY